MLSLELPYVGVNGAWAVGLTLNQTMNPITLVSPMRPGETDQPVTSRSMAELGFSYALAGRYEIGGLLPIMTQSGDQPMFSGLAPAEGTALGDLAVHAKASLLDSSPLSLGASATFTLPTGSDDQFAGADSASLHARGIGGFRSGRIMVGVNGGFRLRGTAELGDVDQGNELTYGLAGAYRVLPELSAIGELFGAFGVGSDETTGVSPLEWLAGARYRVSQQISVAGGVGWGLMNGIGAPDFRGFVHLTYSPKASAIEPFPVTKGDVVVIDRGDDDGDGIINSDDECPKEAEDIDDWQDDDGCPEVDNDDDGLADGADPCPNDAEDADGFKDDDGCPDPDNDEDKILDVDDKCPSEPEDVDGFEDDDGCDDPDNDSDGIPDVIDQCALEPEVINGNNDDDGCPDDGESLVMVMADRMELFEGVKFKGKSAKIVKKSHNVLGQVAATMRANRDFLRIRISVHVHPRNKKDEALSKKRAEAVKQWLIDWGIEPERLDVKGYGSTRPLVKKGRGAAAINDRVEFIILEKKVE
jgi:outer membrane protein OmpA-like peptidoglycan-associated protein